MFSPSTATTGSTLNKLRASLNCEAPSSWRQSLRRRSIFSDASATLLFSLPLFRDKG
jgi:hypothetical protein